MFYKVFGQYWTKPAKYLVSGESAAFTKHIHTLILSPAIPWIKNPWDIKHRPYKFCTAPLTTRKQKMDADILLPPPSVRGMTELNREAFEKKVIVPHIVVDCNRVQYAIKYLKKYLLKIRKLKPVQSCEDQPERKVLLLNPLLVKKYEDIKEEFLSAYGSDDAVFEFKEVVLEYDNWEALETLRAVLPEDQEGAQSYSIIGHILHLNLREHLLPYKTLIGNVYMDKIPNISLVVNKIKEIDSTYRNFQMEVLAGSGDTNVLVKENGCTFTMDFAKVYWNPRLATEHERIVKKLKHGDVLYDVMAGIGPFAMPAGRKKCYVLANDLNPSSFEALVKNCSINKVKERVRYFNLDGHEFIKTVLKKDLLEKWADSTFNGEIHVTMNLPAMAVEFLPSFIGLFHNTNDFPENPTLPIIHVYMFIKEANEDIAVRMVAEKLGYSGISTSQSHVTETVNCEEITSSNQKDTVNGGKIITCDVNDVGHGEHCTLKKHILEVVNVRTVAPNKIMMRVSFRVPQMVLTSEINSGSEPPCKKIKSNQDDNQSHCTETSTVG